MPFSTYGLCWFFWQYDQNIACFLYISKWPSALSSCLNTCQTKPHAVLLKCSWRLGHIIYWWIGHDRLHQQLVHTHNSPCHDDPLLCCIVTSCVSGRGNRIGPVCVCMSVCLSVFYSALSQQLYNVTSRKGVSWAKGWGNIRCGRYVNAGDFIV